MVKIFHLKEYNEEEEQVHKEHVHKEQVHKIYALFSFFSVLKAKVKVNEKMVRILLKLMFFFIFHMIDS